jgi:hypothetical protein
MAIKAKLGAGQWDMLVCEACGQNWAGLDVDPEWTDEPESGQTDCPACGSDKVIREERG